MIGNFFRVALRSFSRRKTFFLINLLGISVGLATYLILFFYTSAEERYDQFHTHKDCIVRIKASRYHQGSLSREMVDVCLAAGPEIKENFPEVEAYVQMFKTGALVRYGYDWFKTENAGYVSEDFFKIFSFPLLQGNDSLALSRPYTAVVSQSFARKIFKDQDPLGKAVNYKGRIDFEITGVFADMPANSHFELDFMVSFATYRQLVGKVVLEEPWRWDGYITYLLLKPGVSVTSLEEKLPLLVEERTGEWLRNTDQQLELKFQPLTSIHLDSNFQGEWKTNSDGKLILYLKLIAVSILVLAWINYIGLSTAKSLERAREVGVRKVLGSDRGQLIVQFLAESFLLNSLALAVAVLMIAVAGNYWPEYIKGFDQLEQFTAGQWTMLALVLFGGGFLAALYPAFVLSAFNPVTVLKGTFGYTTQGAGVRKSLVAVQFVLSLVLVIWIYTAGRQLQFLRNQSLGFDAHAKLVVHDSEVYDSLYSRRVQAFKNEAVRLPGVEKLSYMESLPGEQIRRYANGVRRIKADTSDVHAYSYLRVDEHFADVLGLTIMAGKNFSHTSIKNKEVMVNELAARQLGLAQHEDAVNEEIYFRGDTVRITGVFRDFYFNSPRTAPKPLIFQFNPDVGNFYMLSVTSAAMRQALEETKKLFAEIFPGQPFLYDFLDEQYEQQYKNDLQFEKALTFFSGLSVWITCLGLLGMSAYTASVRRKEIGIRKVMGATSMQALLLLWKEYFYLVLVASLIAVPAAWYIAHTWLTDFAMKINLSPWIFAVPVAALLLITLSTVAFQTIKAARANPVESIRHE